MSSIIKVNTVQDTDGNNIINENANTITIGASGDTISIPAGATLANNGTATGFASIDWQSTIVTGATHTASANQGIWIDTTSNACNLTLPGSPSVGDQLIFSDFKRIVSYILLGCTFGCTFGCNLGFPATRTFGCIFRLQNQF